MATQNCQESILYLEKFCDGFVGVGPGSEVERLSNADLVLDHKSYWIDNKNVGKDMFDHTYSQLVIKVPKVADFSFR